MMEGEGGGFLQALGNGKAVSAVGDLYPLPGKLK